MFEDGFDVLFVSLDLFYNFDNLRFPLSEMVRVFAEKDDARDA
ncbi:MAG: hypothetical protein WBA12_15245 [Catalinimonas sp.]